MSRWKRGRSYAKKPPAETLWSASDPAGLLELGDLVMQARGSLPSWMDVPPGKRRVRQREQILGPQRGTTWLRLSTHVVHPAGLRSLKAPALKRVRALLSGVIGLDRRTGELVPVERVPESATLLDYVWGGGAVKRLRPELRPVQWIPVVPSAMRVRRRNQNSTFFSMHPLTLLYGQLLMQSGRRKHLGTLKAPLIIWSDETRRLQETAVHLFLTLEAVDWLQSSR